MTYLSRLGGVRPAYSDLEVGDEVVVDRTWVGVVTKTSVYVSGSMTREVGVSVRPVDGGRARPVSVRRLTVFQETETSGDATMRVSAAPDCVQERKPSDG